MSSRIDEILHSHRSDVVDEIGVYHATISEDIKVLDEINAKAKQAIYQALMDTKPEGFDEVVPPTDYSRGAVDALDQYSNAIKELFVDQS